MRAGKPKLGRPLVLFPINFVSRTSSRAWQSWALVAPATISLLRRSSLGLADPLLAARGHHRVHHEPRMQQRRMRINTMSAPEHPRASCAHKRSREADVLSLPPALSLVIPLSCSPGASLLFIQQHEVLEARLPPGCLCLRSFGPACFSRSRRFRPERPRRTYWLRLPRNKPGVSTRASYTNSFLV